jgi:glycosyltransferase involved in cell wall biosynthesis
MLSYAMTVELAPPRFSLVIPAYNEETCLPRLLASVEAAAHRYTRGAEAVEVIIADNASTDRTAELARARGCRVAPVVKRSIAAARNGGAAEARGEILGFVDADMCVHPETFNAIDAALRSDRIVGGATGVTLDRWSLGIAVTFAAFLPVVWLTGFDTGVVFCRRQDFHAAGGYDESLRVAEDVSFLLALRRLGRTRRQRLTRLRHAKAVVSMRKFDDHGDWHYLTKMPGIAVGLLLKRKSSLDAAERYWYEPRR